MFSKVAEISGSFFPTLVDSAVPKKKISFELKVFSISEGFRIATSTIDC